MSADKNTNERLASLEARLEFIKELLKEIREDVKDSPTREELKDLEVRVDELEKTYNKIMLKVAVSSAILGLIGGALIKVLG